jgi:hypothetical protein
MDLECLHVEEYILPWYFGVDLPYTHAEFLYTSITLLWDHITQDFWLNIDFIIDYERCSLFYLHFPISLYNLGVSISNL